MDISIEIKINAKVKVFCKICENNPTSIFFDLQQFHDCKYWQVDSQNISHLASLCDILFQIFSTHYTSFKNCLGGPPPFHMYLAFRTTGLVGLPACKERCWFLCEYDCKATFMSCHYYHGLWTTWNYLHPCCMQWARPNWWWESPLWIHVMLE